MILKTAKTTFMALSALLLLSCGEGHGSKTLVKDFMKHNMVLDDYKIIGWSQLKDTYFVSDSMTNVMHKNAELSGLVKQGAKYTPPTEKLRFIQVEYTVNEDTLKHTFYLDDKLTGIVSIK